MKKFWIILLTVLCFASAFAFVSCGGAGSDEEPGKTPEEPAAVYEVRFFAGETQVGETQKVAAGDRFVLPSDDEVVSNEYTAVIGWTVRGGDGSVFTPDRLDRTVTGNTELQAVIGLKPHRTITLEGFRTDFAYLDSYEAGEDARVKMVCEDGSVVYLPESEYKVIVPDDFGKACKAYEIAVTMNLSGERVGYRASVSYQKRHLKVLVIGNSYSDDTIAYAYAIASSLGLDDVVVADLYVGSCSIAQHVDFATHDQAKYLYRYFDKNHTDTDVDVLDGPRYTMEYGLKDRDWDYIVLQQNSLYSGMESEYNLLGDLVQYVRRTATNPDAKIVFNMTWAYKGDSGNASFPNYGYSQARMYSAIVSAMQNCVVPMPGIVGLVPCGTAIQNARTSFVGDHLTRDNFDHLDKGLGRYIAGLTLVCALTGADPARVTYAPEGLTENEISMAKECVANAVATPFYVTFSKYQG